MTEEYEEPSAFEQAKAEARQAYTASTLLEMVASMADYAEQKERIEAELSIVNAWYDVLRMEVIPEKMDTDGVENIRIEGIGRVSLTADMFTAVTNKEGLFQWFKDNKLDDLIQPTVNASTLKAFIKRRIKEAKDYPTECVRVTPFTRASITKK